MSLVNIEYNSENFVFNREDNPEVYDSISEDMKNLKYKNIISKIQDYVYECWDIDFIPGYEFTFCPLNDNNILLFDEYPVKAIYGVCDNIEQIFERESYIQNIINSDKDYIIVVSYIDKEKMPSWRWHKNGKYIGNFEITEEFIGNEKNPNIKGVISYKIYQVNKK